MFQHGRRCNLGVGLLLVAVSLAPIPAQQPAPVPDPPAGAETPATLARARAEAGTKAYELAWSYYSQDRIDADKVYRWSKRAREADLDAATDKAGRVAAAATHLERMLKLDAKIAKIRRLGFGTSLDVVEAEYYCREAESWLAAARAR